MASKAAESVLDWEYSIDEEVILLQGDPRLKLVVWTRDGVKLDDNCRNVAFWHQGIGEHTGRYRHVGYEVLSRCGALDAFITADMRGHGGSGGARGAISGTDELENDVIERLLPAIAERCNNDLKLILMGHSLGGLITTGIANRPDVLYNLNNQGRIVGVFLSAPAIDIVVHGVVNQALAPLAHVVARLPGMRRVTKANDISGTLISHDRKVVSMYDNGDTELTNQVSFGIASSLLSRGGQLVKEVARKDGSTSVLRSDTPVLILHGEEDNLTRTTGSEKLANAIEHRVEFETVPQSLHEMHNELPQFGRNVFFDKLTNWTDKVLSEASE